MEACCAIKLSSTPGARAEEARSDKLNSDQPSGHRPALKSSERKREHLDAMANRLALGGLACGVLTFVNATVCFPIAGAVVNDLSTRLVLTTVPVLVPLLGAGLLTWAAMHREEKLDALGHRVDSNQPRGTARLVRRAGERSDSRSDSIVGGNSSMLSDSSSSNGRSNASSDTDSDVLISLPSTSNSDSSDSSDSSDRSWT